jgi:hypothetical protein
MSVELDGMQLIRHVREDDAGATKMLRSVFNIGITDKRQIVEHKIPGLEGGVLQDLGRVPVRISFEGIIYGEDAKEALEEIRAKFKTGEPVPFSSDLSGVAEVTQVLIEDFQVEDEGGVTNRYRYFLSLREYVPPPPEEESAPSQDEEAEEEVEDEADDALASVNVITGKVLDPDGNPKADVDVKITWDGGEFSVKTDEEGVYRKDDLEPGTYTVTVDAPGYEDVEEEIEIKSQGE